MPLRPEAVYLHIGHNKTGSSFLQSALALSEPALTAQGLAYPISAKQAQTARKGLFNGGNLHGRPGKLSELMQSGPEDGGFKGQTLLISAESFFFYMLRDLNGFLDEYRSACPDLPLRVLLYIRDPLDHAVSQYHQRVKRIGYSGSLADSLTSYDTPASVARIINRLRKSGAEVTVLNYSRHRAALITSFETWLGLPEGSLTLPDQRQVNRSLTRAELELQRALNAQLGKAARQLLADPLCTALPDLRADTPPLSRAALDSFLTRMQEMTHTPAFQRAVPEAERPHIGTVEDHIARFPDPDDDTPLTFTAAQLELLGAQIGKALQKGGFAQD